MTRVRSSRTPLTPPATACPSLPTLAGAKTPLAQFVCAWVVGFVLIFLTSLFEKLPYNVLAAIIIVSVSTLVEYEQVRTPWLRTLALLRSLCGRRLASPPPGCARAAAGRHPCDLT